MCVWKSKTFIYDKQQQILTSVSVITCLVGN